ncbi:MAG: FAD-dependent oxidoreductase [Fodinibius sp.]|nr:FAD-dependent oxidoreductase [Fodinibius sp.]
MGAGIVGLSTALFYQQEHPEARVAVFERGLLPKGASTRNAGFACVGSIGEHLADMAKESEQNIRNRIRRRYQGLELLKQTLGTSNIGYEHCGGYEFFRSQETFEEVAAEIDRFNGWMEELVDEDQVYRADEIAGYPVIANRLEGSLHPGKMMQHLVRRAMAVGVDIKWNCEVQQTAADGTVTLVDGNSFSADRVVHAANGFVQKLLPQVDVRPARGYVLVTDEQDTLPWKGIFHHDKGYIYFRNVGSRLLIGGARNIDKEAEQTDQFGTNSAIKNHLVTFVNDVLRLPAGWTIEHQWSGIMGFTPTKTPIIEQMDERRYVAAGLSGMGIAIGMDVGRTTAGILQ